MPSACPEVGGELGFEGHRVTYAITAIEAGGACTPWYARARRIRVNLWVKNEAA